MKLPLEEAFSFLEQVDPEIRKKYSEYKKKEKEKLTGELERIISSKEENPFFEILLRHERWFSQFSDGFKVNRSTSIEELKLMQFCYNISVLKEADIVDVSGNKIDKSLSEFYGKQIIDAPESFWDVFFEMEVAALLTSSGLDIYPIDESQNHGNAADILYRNDRSDIYVECKNKRRSTPYEWELERFAVDITEKLQRTHNLLEEINNDSFAIELVCDEDLSKELLEDRDYREKLIKLLSSNLYDLITKKGKSIEISFDGISFRMNLTSYYEGIYKRDLTKEEYKLIQQKKDISAAMNPFEHLEVEPNSLRNNGHGDFKCKFEGRQIQVFQSYIFNLRIPWDIEYHEWINRTIRDALEQHKNENNLIVCVKVPPGIVYKMRTEKTLNFRGDERVTKWERLRELIIGIFSDENRRDRLMSVVLSTDILIPKNGEQLQPAHCIYFNDNVCDKIPDQFKDFAKRHIEIGEQFDFLAYFLMGKISR